MQIAMQPTPSNATISIIHKPVSSPLRLLRRPIPQSSPRTIQSTPSSLKRSNTPLKLITPLGSKHLRHPPSPLTPLINTEITRLAMIRNIIHQRLHNRQRHLCRQSLPSSFPTTRLRLRPSRLAILILTPRLPTSGDQLG